MRILGASYGDGPGAERTSPGAKVPLVTCSRWPHLDLGLHDHPHADDARAEGPYDFMVSWRTMVVVVANRDDSTETSVPSSSAPWWDVGVDGSGYGFDTAMWGVTHAEPRASEIGLATVRTVSTGPLRIANGAPVIHPEDAVTAEQAARDNVVGVAGALADESDRSITTGVAPGWVSTVLREVSQDASLLVIESRGADPTVDSGVAGTAWDAVRSVPDDITADGPDIPSRVEIRSARRVLPASLPTTTTATGSTKPKLSTGACVLRARRTH